MRTEIVPGVYLSVVPTTQFKTTSIAVHFLMPTETANFAARTLLTSVLETSSARYPQQTAIAAELERLYGANFGIGVGRDGQLHRVNATMSVVNDQIAQTDLLVQAIAFLREVLFNPLVDEAGNFSPATVARERENLVAYLSSLNEDRQTQANLGAQALYFETASQRMPNFGTVETMEAVTDADLSAAYQQMIHNNQIEIIVLGDVTDDTVRQLISTFDLSGRIVSLPPMQYQQAVADSKHETVTAAVNQAKLNLVYQAQVGLYDEDYYAFLVAQDLFGGSPLSLLFTNVREKASLAYYANTSFDPFRQFLLVQTGIDPSRYVEAESEINKQLLSLQAGNFSEELLQVIKDGLINGRLTAYDAPRFLVRQAYLAGLVPGHSADFADYRAAIARVDKARVVAAAQKIVPQGSYFLTNEEKMHGMD